MLLNRSLDTLICRIILSNIWQSAASPYIKEAQKAVKLLNKILFFKSALLILTVSTNTFHSTNSFCCFSRCQAPTNSVAPYFCIYKPHTTHNSLIRSDEGLTLKMSASESLYGGQFTLSTQFNLIKPNYLVILPPTQHHSFFRNLPPLFFCSLYFP